MMDLAALTFGTLVRFRHEGTGCVYVGRVECGHGSSYVVRVESSVCGSHLVRVGDKVGVRTSWLLDVVAEGVAA